MGAIPPLKAQLESFCIWPAFLWLSLMDMTGTMVLPAVPQDSPFYLWGLWLSFHPISFTHSPRSHLLTILVTSSVLITQSTGSFSVLLWNWTQDSRGGFISVEQRKSHSFCKNVPAYNIPTFYYGQCQAHKREQHSEPWALRGISPDSTVTNSWPILFDLHCLWLDSAIILKQIRSCLISKNVSIFL